MDEKSKIDKQLEDLKNLGHTFQDATKEVPVGEKVESIEKIEDFAEGDEILKELNESIARAKAEMEWEEEQKTFGNRIKPFILPIVITLLALFLTILLLYFFSKSKQENAVKAITNTGNVEVVDTKKDIVIVQEPEPEPVATTTEVVEPTATPTIVVFEDGTTTEVNVNFSYDKYNYDNFPRGIYLNQTQIFDGDYEGYKINATNRAYANDFFFGRDRYMVSLIGDCNFVIDQATILVSNFKKGNKTFTGKVEKIIDSSKPHIVCPKY